MPRTTIKTDALHFSLYAEANPGDGIVAEVVEFIGNAGGKVVFHEVAASIEEAQTKCEEYVNQRLAPTFDWKTPYGGGFVVT